jgi:glycosyltransferase involved in cell wall biosynthesis
VFPDKRTGAEPLKFLFTSSFYPPYHLGGDANHVKYLAEELSKRGHEVHVLHSLDAYRVKRKEKRTQVEYDGIITHRIETRFSRSAYEAYLLGSSCRINQRFRNLVKEVEPDVVHHHNISLLGYRILEKQGGYLNLYTAHDYWLICSQANLLRRDLQVCETASCRFCGLTNRRPPQMWRLLAGFENTVRDIDVLIAPSEYTKQKIASRFHMEAATIPNFVPKPPQQIGSSQFSSFLLYAGMLEKHKGVLSLLEAYRKVGKRINLKLVIAGDGTLGPKVEKLIRQYGLSDVVFPLGWLKHERLYALLRDASALVIPSICPENAPLVALEALSVGTPIVGSNLGGLPEIVSKLHPGLVFSWGSDDDLVRAIGFCLENSNKLSERAREVYLEGFSAEAYLDLYSRLLAHPSVPNS